MKLLSRGEEVILLAVWRLEGNAFGISIRDQVVCRQAVSDSRADFLSYGFRFS
jgi:hypothetical protein